MASTYSALKIQLMATGENDGTWGDISNQNYLAFQEMIAGSTTVTFNGADIVLALADTNALQPARAYVLGLVGTMGGAQRNLTVPALSKPYMISNGTDGAVQVKTAAGNGVVVPTGRSTIVIANASGVYEQMNYSSGFLAAGLTVTGGTSFGGSVVAGGDIVGNANIIAKGGLYYGPAASQGALVGDVNTTNMYVDASVNSLLQYGKTNGNFVWYYKGLNKFTSDSAGNFSIPGGFYGATATFLTNFDASMQISGDATYSNFFFKGAGPSSYYQYNKTQKVLYWVGEGNVNFTANNTGDFAVRSALYAPIVNYGTSGQLFDNATDSYIGFNSNCFLNYTKTNGQLTFYVNGVAHFSIDPNGAISAPGGGNLTGNLTVTGAVYHGTTGRFWLGSDNSTFSQIVTDGANGCILRGDWNSGNLQYFSNSILRSYLTTSGGAVFTGNVNASVFSSSIFQVNANAANTWLYFDQPATTGFIYDKANNFIHTYFNSTALFTFAASGTLYISKTLIFRGAGTDNIGTNHQIDGVTRWVSGSAASTGNFFWNAYNVGGGFLGTALQLGLGDLSASFQGPIKSSQGSGGWFTPPNAIMLNGQEPSISFDDRGFGTKGVIGHSGAGGVSTLFFALGNGASAAINFGVTTGICNATQWAVPSDERLKFDIVPLVGGLDNLTDLNVFTYMQATTEENAAEGVGTPSAGVMAQQLLGGPFDALVNKPRDDGMGGETFYSINYMALTAWFIAAFKEVKARLVATENTLTDLLTRVAALEAP